MILQVFLLLDGPTFRILEAGRQAEFLLAATLEDDLVWLYIDSLRCIEYCNIALI